MRSRMASYILSLWKETRLLLFSGFKERSVFLIPILSSYHSGFSNKTRTTFIFYFVCVWCCLHNLMCKHNLIVPQVQYLWRPEEGIRYPRLVLQIVGSHFVGAGN